MELFENVSKLDRDEQFFYYMSKMIYDDNLIISKADRDYLFDRSNLIMTYRRSPTYWLYSYLFLLSNKKNFYKKNKIKIIRYSRLHEMIKNS